jgi:hypothetical protein
MDVIDLQCCIYCCMLSDISSRFKWSMTTFHYKNARMHNIPTFVSKIDMDLCNRRVGDQELTMQETTHQQPHRACKVLGDSRTQSELGSQILYKKCHSKSDHNDMKYNTNDTKYNI